jgi:hypothetical protein
MRRKTESLDSLWTPDLLFRESDMCQLAPERNQNWGASVNVVV